MQTAAKPGTERANKWRSLFVERGLMEGSAPSQDAGLRVTRLEMGPGRITAAVADKAVGKALGDCEVSVEMPSWQDEQWADVIDLLSRQALYAAQMLASDFPDDLEPMLQQQNLSLLPTPHEVVNATCSCCDASGAYATGDTEQQIGCPHISVVLSEAGAMLADDAWLLFLLRGRVREQVLRALRRKRGQNGDGNGSASQGKTPQASVHEELGGLGQGQEPSPEAKSLSEDMHRFWGSTRVQEQFRPHIVPPVAELMLLNRLGPPAFSHANAEVFDTLSNIYRRVTEAALALAFAEDLPEERDEDGQPASLGDKPDSSSSRTQV